MGVTYSLLKLHLTSLRIKDSHVVDGPACQFHYVPVGTGDVAYPAIFGALAADRADVVVAVATHFLLPDGGQEGATRLNFARTRQLMQDAAQQLT